MNLPEYYGYRNAVRCFYLEALDESEISSLFDHFVHCAVLEVKNEFNLPDFLFFNTSGFGRGSATTAEIQETVREISHKNDADFKNAHELFQILNIKFTEKFDPLYEEFLQICQSKTRQSIKSNNNINKTDMSTNKVNLQFCGWAKIIDGPFGNFYSMELNKEQLGKIISEFQNENDYVDLSIAEKREHKPDEKNTHYVYSNVKYQKGQDTSGVINLRIYKDDLAKVPTKDEHKAYFVTISPVDKEKARAAGKEPKSDFSVYVKDQESGTNYGIGSGWDTEAQRETSQAQSSTIFICGSASLVEKEGKKYYSIMLNKDNANDNGFDMMETHPFIDFTLAEKKEHTEGEKSTHYIYTSLKYQDEKDNNPNAIMTLRIYRDEFYKAKNFNGEHSILAGVYERDKEKATADGKEYKSDYVIYAANPNNKEDTVYLGSGFLKEAKAKQLSLNVGDPVHIKVNDPVLKEFIGHTEQAAFGYIVAKTTDQYKVHCCCGMYWCDEKNTKKATIENVRKFDADYQNMRADLNKEKSEGKGKSSKTRKNKETEVNIQKEKDISDDLPF